VVRVVSLEPADDSLMCREFFIYPVSLLLIIFLQVVLPCPLGYGRALQTLAVVSLLYACLCF